MNNSDPQTILKAFEKLQIDFQHQETHIATKEFLAAKQRDRELVNQAATYTSENIFQCLAKLQSAFGQSTEGLSKAMTAEVEKLAQIQRAIQVENERLEALHHLRIAAEALNIFQQEHQNTMSHLEEEYRKKDETLDKEISKQREIWQKRQQDYEATRAKQNSILVKARKTEEDEYIYQLKRQQTEESNAYEKQKRLLERQLAEEQQKKAEAWQERESFLTKHQEELEGYKVKIEAMPKELDEAVKKAREEAIKETYREEENKAKLVEKDMEAKRKSLALRIESLQNTVEKNKAQLSDLSTKLQTALQQAQQLAMTAVSSSGSGTKSSEKGGHHG